MGSRLSVRLLTALLAAVAMSALAQAWTTLCKDERCGISINVNDQANKNQKVMTLALVMNKDGTDPSLVLTTPLGVSLEPGVRLIAGPRNIELKFKVCYPDGCQAFQALAAADVADLRKAPNVDVQFFAQSSDKLFSARIDFSGLGAAIDETMK